MLTKALPIITLCSIVIASCATYSPKPLLDNDIAKALAMPSAESINSTVQSHSKLKSIPIDFNQPLSVQQIALIAVITNPELKALRAKNDIANAQIFSAGLLPDPQFTPQYELPTAPPVTGITAAYALILNWDIGSLVTRSLKEAAAKEAQQQVHYDIAWQEWMVANQAELFATRIYYLQQQDTLLQQSLLLAKNYLAKTLDNLKYHDANIDEFNLQKSAYLDLQNQSQTTKRVLGKTKLQLTKIMGLPPKAEIKLIIAPNLNIPSLGESQLFILAKQNRLDLLALKAGYNNQEIQLRQAILGQYPHFSATIYPGQDNTNNRFFGTNVTFDLPIFNRNRGAIAIATATREGLYLDYISRLHDIQSEIFTIYKEATWAMNQEKSINSSLPSMRDTNALLKNELLNSNITLPKYLIYYATVLDKELKLLLLQQDIAEQRIAMQMVLGKYLNELKS